MASDKIRGLFTVLSILEAPNQVIEVLLRPAERIAGDNGQNRTLDGCRLRLTFEITAPRSRHILNNGSAVREHTEYTNAKIECVTMIRL